jgi:hypothetical protein
MYVCMYIYMYLGVAGIFVFSPLYLSIFYLPFHWQSPTLHMHWPYKIRKSSCCKSMQEFCLLWNMYFTWMEICRWKGKGCGGRGGEGRGFLVGDFTCFSLFVCLWVAWCGLQRTRPVKRKKKSLRVCEEGLMINKIWIFQFLVQLIWRLAAKSNSVVKNFKAFVSHQIPSNGCARSKRSCNELHTYSPSKQVILQWLPIVVVVVVIQRAKTLAQTLFHFSRTASNQ